MLAIGADCIIAIDGDEQVDLTDDGSAELSKMNENFLNNFKTFKIKRFLCIYVFRSYFGYLLAKALFLSSFQSNCFLPIEELM